MREQGGEGEAGRTVHRPRSHGNFCCCTIFRNIWDYLSFFVVVSILYIQEHDMIVTLARARSPHSKLLYFFIDDSSLEIFLKVT